MAGASSRTNFSGENNIATSYSPDEGLYEDVKYRDRTVSISTFKTSSFLNGSEPRGQIIVRSKVQIMYFSSTVLIEMGRTFSLESISTKHLGNPKTIKQFCNTYRQV